MDKLREQRVWAIWTGTHFISTNGAPVLPTQAQAEKPPWAPASPLSLAPGHPLAEPAPAEEPADEPTPADITPPAEPAPADEPPPRGKRGRRPPAVPAGELVTYDEASAYWRLCVERSGYPPRHTLALSLDAAGLVSIILLNTFDENRGIEQGADEWASVLNSYTERCAPEPDGISLRILVRGVVPAGAVSLPRVRVQTTGLVPITGARIPARRGWCLDNNNDVIPDDNRGVIRDGTEAMKELMVPKPTMYAWSW